MSRITVKHLRESVESANDTLASIGSTKRLECGGRNGYQAVDSYSVDGNGDRIGSGVDCMIGGGTSREVCDYVEQWLSDEKLRIAKLPPLQQAMLRSGLGLIESDFAFHASDLYVVAKPGVKQWLDSNLDHPRNVTSFISQEGSGWNGAGKQCFDIPFMGHWPSVNV